MPVGDAVHRLSTLPNRTAWVQSGEHTAQIMTLDASAGVDAQELDHRLSMIREQTRAKYCRPRAEVEAETAPEQPMQPKLSRWEAEE